jgi:hypothetical protein
VLLGRRPRGRRPSGAAYFFRALPFETTIVSTTVLSGRCFTSFRLMNRPVAASRATVFPAVCRFFTIVLAPFFEVVSTYDALILGALSVRAAHRFTGSLPIPDDSTEPLMSNAWYSNTANTTLTSTELSQDSYVLSYMCSWTGNSWKCGCRDQACTQSLWQIQKLQH